MIVASAIYAADVFHAPCALMTASVPLATITMLDDDQYPYWLSSLSTDHSALCIIAL